MATRHAGGQFSDKPTWCNSKEDAPRRLFCLELQTAPFLILSEHYMDLL